MEYYSTAYRLYIQQNKWSKLIKDKTESKDEANIFAPVFFFFFTFLIEPKNIVALSADHLYRTCLPFLFTRVVLAEIILRFDSCSFISTAFPSKHEVSVSFFN